MVIDNVRLTLQGQVKLGKHLFAIYRAIATDYQVPDLHYANTHRDFNSGNQNYSEFVTKMMAFMMSPSSNRQWSAEALRFASLPLSIALTDILQASLRVPQ